MNTTPKLAWTLAWRRARKGFSLPRPLDQKAKDLLVERSLAESFRALGQAITAAAPR